jgi:mRNA interferase RelE/StbE|tara:strand:- start:156 stop:410 length:255 start_codon:yes stop_codon:yes gene_type:complete
MFSIDITSKAFKFLSKLNDKEKEIILNKIYSIRDNPFRFVKKLEGAKLWRLRIEDYRAVLDIVISGNKITVLRIGHRKNIYKNL